MSEQKIRVPRAIDLEVINFFSDIISIIGVPEFSIKITGMDDFITFNENLRPIQLECFKKSCSIQEARVLKNRYKITYNRGSTIGDLSVYFDIIKIDIPDKNDPNNFRPDQNQAQKINDLIDNRFSPGFDQSAVLFHDKNAFEQIIASHQLILSRLENSLATVGEKLVNERINIESEYRKAREKTESEFKDAKASLDREYEIRLDNLSAEKAELEKRTKELDDRDNTHARRQIRADLKKRIEDHAKNFSLTDGTRTLRLPIHILTWFALAVLGTATYYFGADINHMVSEAAARDKAIGATEVVVLALKPLGLTVAFLGLLTWYLRWMNRWFERHSEAEFQLKQFELDVDRASWVVETALEWRQEQQAPMPDHLIESISRNLFSRSEKDEAADMHPADYLASALLGRASGLKLKLPGADLEYDGKALKEAKQTADKAKSS